MAPKTAREINTAHRANPTEMAARAAHADLCAATGAVDVPDMTGVRDQEADIKAWYAAADRAYNARVAAAREAGTLSGVPERPATPAFWPPRAGDVWITRHGWEWELRGGRMVAEVGSQMSVEAFRGAGAVLFRRVGTRGLWEVLEVGVGV